MAQITSPDRKSLLLSVRLSLWLVGVAILPLLLALLISEVPSRTALINQASTSMITDAKVHAKLIDTYLANKEAIIGSLSNDPQVQAFFVAPKLFTSADRTLFVQDGLSLERFLYPEISLVDFIDATGAPLLSYSSYNNTSHGTFPVPAGYLQRVLQGQQFFSGVYYDSKTRISSSMLYTPVFASSTSSKVVGFVRDTLNLASLWNIVTGEKGANGSGSYAFLLDQNGVRIIDPDPHTLFTSIAPLSPQLQQQIQSQGLYGLAAQQVPVIADRMLQSIQSQNKPPTAFQDVPADQQTSFQVTWQRLTTVPWMYFTLTPVNTVEAVANQQLLILTLLAVLIIIPVAVIGWFVGRRISSPVLRSTNSLVKSSTALNQLAERGENAASQQVWIIDSSQVGLASVEYYTKASKKAIWRLNDLSKEWSRQKYKNPQAVQQDRDVMNEIGEYLKKAIAYQDESNKNVSTAINVSNEVASQLVSGARATKEVAEELNHTIEQLRDVVGDA
ncbi:MAG: cache domain-containing protein [Ktedonobacteraceae bacterium]